MAAAEPAGAGEKIWDAGKARDPDFTCAKMFWWYNMYATADWSATPRPMYPADGRKIPDHYAYPPDLHDELDAKLGQFPLFKFWGPLADITSSDWIAKATLHVMETRIPTLTLTYLPHLDYNLQRLGPDLSHPRLQQDLREIDDLCGELIDHADATGQRVIVVSEYGITRATDAVHINRALRQAGTDRSAARGIRARGPRCRRVRSLRHGRPPDRAYLRQEPRPDRRGCSTGGVARRRRKRLGCGWQAGQRARSSPIRRAGCDRAADRWFSYYYWLDDAKAPDFARTVDIHRKPGYDPVELFVDPEIRFPKLAAGWKLAKRKLGQRQLLDIISLKDTKLVKGTHGRITDDPMAGPLVISSEADLLPAESVDATDFKDLVLRHVFG